MLFIFGTRPEAVKVCPLISELRAEPFRSALEPIVCVTGQHRELLAQVLPIFDIQPDLDLGLMHHNQGLAELSSRLLVALPGVLRETQPALTVVQGDTTSTFCGALASFYAGVDVAHVEAGLRTHDPRHPFPEELNRVLTSRLARLHFAPTHRAADNLRLEGVASDRVEVTGNTGIDALFCVRARLRSGASSGLALKIDERKKLVVVTAHRRESFGPEMANICWAIRQIAERDDVQIVWPVHPNPNVLQPVQGRLGHTPHVTLIEPLEYLPFVDLMQRAYLLITDSGGIQEEAPSLGKPVLVLRNVTERPEAVAAGTAILVGTEPDKIVAETVRLLEDAAAYNAMARLDNPYGDGTACRRIATRILSHISSPAGAALT